MMLDLATLKWIWLTGIISLVFAIPALLGAKLARQSALLHWWLGLVMILLASLTVLSAGAHRSLATVLISNFSGILGYNLILNAVLGMNSQKLSPTGLWLPALAVAIAQILQPHDMGSRVMLYCFIVSGQLFACAMLSLLPNREISLHSRAILAIGFVFGSLIYGAQAWDVASHALALKPDVLPEQNPLYVLQTFFFLLLTSVLFILLELERDDSISRRLATLDGLTGVYNRRTLMELGQRELAGAQRRHRALAVLMIDIDGLRRINETRGAFVGDQILVHLVEQLTVSLQRQDLFGRLAGDKFCAVLPDTALDGALHVAERIRARVESSSFAECGARYTVSVGVCVRSPSELGIAQSIARAETAMQLAHKTGNRVEHDLAVNLSRAEISQIEPSR